MTSIMEWLSRNISFPLWDVYEQADRLAELRRLRKSQWLAASEIRLLQIKRFNALLQYARTKSKYYQSALSHLPETYKIADLSDLHSLPILEKEELRGHMSEILTRNRTDLLSSKTGGSTGVSLHLWFDRRTQEHRNAAEMRSSEWAGRLMGAQTALIWGNTPQMFTCKERIRNFLMERVFYLDTMLINASTVTSFVDEWNRWRGQCVLGHAHSVYILAKIVEQLGLKMTPPKAIITSSMMLLDKERIAIEQVLRCPVTNRYGCEEVGLIASECEAHTGMHVNSEHVVVEILDKDGKASASGEVIITDLINHAMPLIRYRIGDHATLSSVPCSCGRSHGMIEKIVGRTADFLKKVDGGLVAGVSLVERTLTAIPGIERLQIVQEALRSFRLNVVPDLRFSPKTSHSLVNEIKAVFGDDVEVSVVTTDTLEILRNGKYRFSICRA